MIITISREFGSGGRELGKRLSDALHIPCYDNEIIKMIAEEHGFDENYVSRMSEKSIQSAYSLTIGHRFAAAPSYVTKQAIKIAVEQRKIIENFGKQGDCVIVGRCADIILKDYCPFNIFVYADKDAKLQRCMERAPEGEKMTRTELERLMHDIDKNRASYRDFYTDAKWGAKENYHLCINTTGVEIKSIVPQLADYIKIWFLNHHDSR